MRILAKKSSHVEDHFSVKVLVNETTVNFGLIHKNDFNIILDDLAENLHELYNLVDE